MVGEKVRGFMLKSRLTDRAQPTKLIPFVVVCEHT